MVVVLFALGAGQARADLRRVESATIGGTLSDGDRYAAWVRGPQIRVLDEQTGKVASFPIPAGCRAPSALGAGVVATICGKEFRTMDVATGAWTTLPATESAASLFFADSVGVTAVGAAWIEVWVEVGYHAPAFNGWINRATGVETNLDRGDLSRHVDLDAAELWTPLCAPLRRFKDPDWDSEAQYGSPYIAPLVAGTRALEVRRGDLVMRRCGSSRVRVITRSPDWDVPYLAAGRVSWIDQDGLAALDELERGRGAVRTFAAGRVRSWPVPGKVNPNLQVVHTRSHVFVDKFSSGWTHRYSIGLK